MLSANIIRSEVDDRLAADRESIKTTDRRGPIIDPWGFPEFILAVLETEPRKTTRLWRSLRMMWQEVKCLANAKKDTRHTISLLQSLMPCFGECEDCFLCRGTWSEATYTACLIRGHGSVSAPLVCLGLSSPWP